MKTVINKVLGKARSITDIVATFEVTLKELALRVQLDSDKLDEIDSTKREKEEAHRKEQERLDTEAKATAESRERALRVQAKIEDLIK